ncbi:MAG: integral rane sensor signal transduction histidine kinase [Deltaproteobacteria bacterium]|nr:integral rane sensor signal transduction histidine kinase [Deltaproteobacteria bacterium]
MKVATRITVATAVVVAIAAGTYAGFDLRNRTTERRMAIEREAKAVANTLRAGLETQASGFRAPTELQVRDLGRATGGWRVFVLPRTRNLDLPSEEVSAGQLKRLRTMLDVPQLSFADIEDGQYYYAIPIRSVPTRDEERLVVGMLEIARPVDVIETTTDDLVRALVLVILIVLVTTIMVGALASRFVSRPITKLLRGIDDVAKGDLSHVILSERDDEIGTIATRFNEMTFSLRESRSETQRQNEAKLSLEQRLGHTEKLATIGQLAAEIAHEVGTPLNVIAGRARSIQRKSKDPEAVAKNAGIVAEQTARITRIIQRLLDFSRRKVGTTDRGAVNLNALAVTTMELLAGQFSVAKVKTRLDRAESLPSVAGDASSTRSTRPRRDRAAPASGWPCARASSRNTMAGSTSTRPRREAPCFGSTSQPDGGSPATRRPRRHRGRPRIRRSHSRHRSAPGPPAW